MDNTNKQQPQHIQQEHQAPIRPQSTYPSQIHAQPAGYAVAQYGFPPFQQRHNYPPQQYPPGVAYNQNTMPPYPYPPQVSSQYPPTAWSAQGFPPAQVATPSSQELSSTTQSTPSRPLPPKRAVTKAVMKDPKTNQEVDWEKIAREESKSSNAKSSTSGTTSTQSSATEKKPNPITSANTNNVTNSVTTSSSDRTNTSSPPSISNELLRKVSEDTDLDKRQTAATTITTTTTPKTTRATITAPTTKPETTTKPTPIVTPTAIKPTEKVETKVNNINGNHEPLKDTKEEEEEELEKEKEKEKEEKKEIVKEVDVEVVEEKNNDDGNEAAEESTVDKEDGTEVKSETEEDVEMHYEPWQYNPLSKRTGKKKYSRQFLIDVCEKILKLPLFDEEKRDDSMDNYAFTQVDMFAPAFSRNNMPAMANRQNDTSRRPNHQNQYTSSGGQDRTRKIIAPPPALAQEVELKTVANPWRPAIEVKKEVPPEVQDVEKLKKSFRSILNKLTPNNFDNLAKSVTDLNIDTETKLGEVIDIVFAKALSEPGFCVLYGQMCSHLKKITAGTTNFGNTLLRRCQHQFQSDIYTGLNVEEREQKIEEETDPDAKKHMREELYEEKFRCRMRGLGLIKFIGELYKIDMLNDLIMFECIIRLLNDVSEESLECLCDLLVTIGEKLDRSSQKRLREEKKAQKPPPKAANAYQTGKSLANVVASGHVQQSAVPESVTTLDDIFANLHRIRKNKDLDISLRIRFKLLDVCDLREKENWQSKKAKDNNPKKLEEIREAHLEKVASENAKANQAASARRGHDGRRHLGQYSGSSSQISSLGNESGYNRGGANLHGSASSHAIRDHSSEEKATKQNSSDSYESHKHNLGALSFIKNITKPGGKANESDLRPTSKLTLGRPTTTIRPAGK